MTLRPREVAPGVELFAVRTPTLPPATHTNTFALGAREIVLVEPATPYDDERAEWLAWARAMKTSGRTVVGIVATHHHLDHGSAAGFFARALDLPLLAHRETIDRLADLQGVELRELHDGESLVLDGPSPRTWIALHTPGHAPGHVCLHDPDGRTLVAGDMVANGSTILIAPDDGGDMRAYLEQLARLDALGTTTVLPAHGEPIDDPHALFSYYIAHRLKREAKILDAYRALRRELGRSPDARELVPRAYDDTPPHLWPLARGAVEAHLIKLRAEGLV
jgi:glyoxylase-like metal-dependent hydrolase (beta-lactamase superfamily II)